MKSRSLKQVRLATLAFPPLGAFWLWTSREIRLRRKILGSFGITFYSVLYAGLLIFLFLRSGLLEYEFRGGYIPRLTLHKTVPDYTALEANRQQQKKTIPSSPATGVQASAYWNGFRGPRRDGVYDEMPIKTAWPDSGLEPVWKQPIGGGYASFAIADGRAFTIEQRRAQEVATAYDLQSGLELWTNSWDASFREQLGGDGPRATPAFDENRVYVLGALGELRCLNATNGQMLWRKNILTENGAPELTYGMAASPLVLGEKLIVTPGGPAGHSVVAYNKLDGTKIWSSLSDEASYSSPMVVNLAGREQLLIVTAERAVGLDVATGTLLWEFPWIVQAGNRNIAQPVVLATNSIFLSAGYGTGCAGIEVDYSSSNFQARELWRNKQLKNKFSSSVLWQGYVYGLDEDMLTCLDARTGHRQWKEGRYGYGQLLLASSDLIILTGDGELALVKAESARWQEIARFAALRGKTWNHPALGGGFLLVRNSYEMACYKLSYR